jgi:hypothetical protein
MTGPPTSLRRADWRFLLPAPPTGAYDHLVLLGGPADLAGRLHGAGVARRISRRLPPDRSADAVIVLADARVAPARAAQSVADGGVYYCEIDRRHPARWYWTATYIRRALERAGLTAIGEYWTVPDFEHARRYLPLDSASVLGWYFSTLQTAGSPTAFLAEVMVRALVGDDWRRLASWAPCFGVAAIARKSEDHRTVPSVLAHSAVPSAVAGPDVRVAMLTSGQDDGSRVVLLPFLPGSAEPVMVVKSTRSPAFNGNTEREQATLRELRRPLDAELRATIPEPLGTYPMGDLVVGLESYARGRALVVSSGRWAAPHADAIDDLHLAADWLARFHDRAPCRVDRWDAGLSRRVDERLDAYRQRLVSTDAEGHLLALAAARSAELAGATVPTVWLHNDYGPWNIHRAGSQLTVIDWEFGADRAADRTGPPLCDLLYFITTWYGRVRRYRSAGAELRGFRELFLDLGEKNPAVTAARASIRKYLTRLDLDARFAPLLLVYTWADRALDRAERLGRARDGGSDASSSDNRYGDYVRVMARRADQLFAESNA